MKKIIKTLVELTGYTISKSDKARNKAFHVENAFVHNSQKRTNDFYANKKLVKDFISQERMALFTEIIDLIKKQNITLKNKTIGDFGCGTGHFLAKLSEQESMSTYSGFEFSQEAICRAKEFFPSINFQQQNIYEPVNAPAMDLSFCLEVLEHMEYPERAIDTITKATKKKGAIILTVPNGRKDTFEGHIHFWSPESWALFCRKLFPKAQLHFDTLSEDQFLMTIVTLWA